MIQNKVWRGVLIEESLQNTAIPSEFRVIDTRLSFLESEEKRGTMHFHNVEVDDADKDKLVAALRANLKPGWYCHLVNDGVMVVVFSGESFTIQRGDIRSAEAARQYGASQGILSEQMTFEHLLERPFD
jgi:hypothetical protein